MVFHWRDVRVFNTFCDPGPARSSYGRQTSTPQPFAPPVINLVTLGSLQLNGDAGPLLTGRRKILALLARLARQSPAAVDRAELTGLFWPDRSDNHAKQSLRQALAELRAVLGDGLITEPDCVRVVLDACGLDVRLFEEAVHHERWEEAAVLWGGDFLHGLEVVGGPAWSAWLTRERQALRLPAAQVFRSLHAVAERRDDRKAAMDWSAKWCDVAPLDEAAFTARIGSLVKAGRPVDAAVCYEGFVRRLHNELHVAPSSSFEALQQTFAAGRPAPAGKVVIRGTVTLSGLSQLSVDARSVAEAAAVIGEPADAALLQAVSSVTSHSFQAAVEELARHGIVTRDDGGRIAFTSAANRDRVFGVISGDRRLNLQRLVAARTGVVEPRRPAAPPRVVAARAYAGGTRLRPSALIAAGLVIGLLVAGANLASRVSTASAVELEPGSTILLDQVRSANDPAIAGAVTTAAALGLSQSRHVALYRARPASPASGDTTAARARVRDLARREGIPRIIAIDVQGTDSAMRLAARLIDGSSGQVLGEETVETRRARLVDDLDRLLRRVRVTLGEPEDIVRDSSRLLREVASGSIEALSAYAAGVEAWSANRADDARAAWVRAVEHDTAFALAELALANDALQRSDGADSDRWVRRAVAHVERLTALDALRARQMLATRDGRLDEAASLAEQVARRAPTAGSWHDVALVHVEAGRCAEAVPAFERAIALDSTHAPSRFGLAECALAQGNAAAALAQLEVARRLAPDLMPAAEFAHHRARALARAGRFAEADSALRAMLTGSVTDSAAAYRWLASLEMLRGRYGEALPLLQLATRLYRQAGDPPALFDNLILEATAFTAIGGRTRASELIDEAVALAVSRPIPVPGYFQLGHLMARVGRLNGAREILRQATLRATGESERWPVRLLTASVHVAERNAADALAAIDAQDAPRELEPFRLALTADANALAGQHEAALEAARRLAASWHYGEASQDEWMRATLRLARISELAGDTAAARAAYRKYVDRWKEADVFLVELSLAQRSLVRLGSATVAVTPAARGSR